MAKLKIVKVGDDVLRKKCRPVEEINPRILRLLDDMVETMHEANGVGLAAPQVGVLRRIVVIEVEEGNVIELINPKIIEIEAEVNEIYQAMIDCDMLDELKKEFNKEIIQRIKNILHVKAFHHGNMKKSLQIHAGMKGDALEANMETLIDYVKELKTVFFKRYFMMKAEI